MEAESIVLRGPRRGGSSLPADAAAAALDQALLMEGALDDSFPSGVHGVQPQQRGLNSPVHLKQLTYNRLSSMPHGSR